MNLARRMKYECHRFGFLHAGDSGPCDPGRTQPMMAQMRQFQFFEQPAKAKAGIPRNRAKRGVACLHGFGNETLEKRGKSRVDRLRKIGCSFHECCRIADGIPSQVHSGQRQLALPQSTRLIQSEIEGAPHPPGSANQRGRDRFDFIVLPNFFVLCGRTFQAEPPQRVYGDELPPHGLFEDHAENFDVPDRRISTRFFRSRSQVVLRKLTLDLMRGNQPVCIKVSFERPPRLQIALQRTAMGASVFSSQPTHDPCVEILMASTWGAGLLNLRLLTRKQLRLANLTKVFPPVFRGLPFPFIRFVLVANPNVGGVILMIDRGHELRQMLVAHGSMKMNNCKTATE